VRCAKYRCGASAHAGRFAQRGVSLVEAIVAMAVMAFGMMAVVGLQSTLRLNSDVAKQRSEAVRIAEEAIETARAFSVMAEYDNVVGRVVDPVPDVSTNAVYRLTQTVVGTTQGMKSIQVDVSWVDRAGERQSVTLSSVIAGVEPGMSGVLSVVPGGVPVRQPLGRNPVVPPAAVDVGGGRSAYRPPGAPDTTVLVFDNLSGVITSVCAFPADGDPAELVNAENCFEQPSWLIGGFVRFSFGPNPNATTPTDEQIPLGMYAIATGDAFANGECFVAPVQDPKLTYTSYLCRVPQSAGTTWTGRVLLGPPLDLALYDVCRYSNGNPGNFNHPVVYTGLDRSLGNQNMLVVDQDVACPAGTQRLQPPELLPPPPPPA
jgi:Tfp pilus assembly protein PilV